MPAIIIRTRPPASTSVNTDASNVLSLTPYIRIRERMKMMPIAPATSERGNSAPRYPANPIATVDAPIMPEKIMSHPITKAARFPKARKVYSYSADASGNMDASSA